MKTERPITYLHPECVCLDIMTEGLLCSSLEGAENTIIDFETVPGSWS